MSAPVKGSKKKPAKQGLSRELGLGSASILVIANMIGTGVFTTTGFIMAELHNPAAMLSCWLVGGLFALSGALCYGELGAMFPRAGGEYVFLRQSMGELMGFLSGWISLIVGFSAPIAATAIAFSRYFFRAVPQGLTGGPDSPLFGGQYVCVSPVCLLAVGVITLFTVLHCFSISLGSSVQNALTLFKIAVIVVFIVAGWSYGSGSLEHFSSSFDSSASLSGPFAVSLIFISFAYSGWNAAAYLGAEIKDPLRNLPRSLVLGTGVVIVLYMLLNMTFIYALPAHKMSGVLEVGAQSAIVLFGSRVGMLFSGAISLCLLSVISAMIMVGPRVYYAMARDGLFFRFIGVVSPRHHVPVYAVAVQGFIAVCIAVTSSFDVLLMYIGFTLALFAMLSVCGMVLLRIKSPQAKRPIKTFLYPVTPVFFVLGNAWIIFYSITSRPVVCLYGLGTIAAGVVVYLLFSKNRKEGAR